MVQLPLSHLFHPWLSSEDSIVASLLAAPKWFQLMAWKQKMCSARDEEAREPDGFSFILKKQYHHFPAAIFTLYFLWSLETANTLMFFPVSLQSSVIIVQDLNCMFGVWDKTAFSLFSSGLKRNNEANGFHCNLTLTSSGCFALSFSYQFTRGPLCVRPPVSFCHSSAAALWRKI